LNLEHLLLKGDKMSVKYFEELEIWKLSRQLTNKIYELSRHKSFASDYGLVDQIRRASVSIMSNIAEGFERGGNQELIQFLYIAKGSCGEVRCQLYIAYDQGYINKDEFEALLEKTRKVSGMIKKFIDYLKGSKMMGEKYKKPPVKPFREEVQEFLQQFYKDKNT
jgi:four helix bundle protein